MDDSSRQWIAMGEPAGEHEAAALRVVKGLLEDSPTTWAWSNLTFRDRFGVPSEVDIILINRNGLFLIELKQRLGTISGNQLTWYVKSPNGAFRSEANPVNLARKKAQRLASLLKDVSPAALADKVPFVHEVVVLHGRDSKVDLDAIAKTHVYGLDTFNVTGVPLFSDLLKAQATNKWDMIDKKRAAFLVGLMGDAGFTARPKIVMVGQYALDDRNPLSAGPGWEDWRASQPMLKGQYRCVRLYPVPFEASQAQRSTIERTAKREYLLTTGLNHPGVVSPLDILSTDRGPALVFPDDTDSMALDDYLAAHRDELDLDARLDLIRQIGEILAYAHRNRVTHRALTPMQVRVIDGGDGPHVAIRDWQTGQQETTATMTATRHAILGGATGLRDLVDEQTQVYLAPEALSPAASPDPIALDVYGLGALAYLILTDSPPAANLAELQERLRAGGLDPAVQRDEIPSLLSELVARATDPDTTSRTLDVTTVLTELADAEKTGNTGSEPEVAVDPLDAQPGDILIPDLLVEDRLGSGATGVALLVSTGDADVPATVLKVAHDSDRAQRLISEAEVLARLDSPRIVQLLNGPHERGGRTCIEIVDAGRPTLGARIHDEGRLTIEQLQNYGRDLFEAVAYLDSQGVQHRDIKPDNLGVRPDRSEQADRRPRLVLFDFSLANESPDHIRSGTRGYLDPFLGGKERPRYDSAAERFAVAATLFHMATGQLPEWGDGTADPAQISDEVTIIPSWFEAQAAEPLTAFFRTALARDIGDRFDGLQEMAGAWDQLFTDLAATGTSSDDTEVESDRDEAAERARLTTPLSDAGLSPRAVSALDRVGVVTVGELLDLPAISINQLPGVGVAVRREIQRRRRRWSELRAVTQEVSLASGRGVEFVARHLIPAPNGKNADAVALATALLIPDDGKPAWPTLDQAAESSNLDQTAANKAMAQLSRLWSRSDVVTELGMDVLAAVQAAGGMLTADEAAQRLVIARGSEADGAIRVRHALPLVRVAVDMDEADSNDLIVSRAAGGQAIVIALADMGDSAESAPRVAAARTLAEVVAAAVAESEAPLVPIRSLALVTESPDAPATGLGDPGRLLTLAAAISGTAAVSSRGELYRRGLPPDASIAAVLKGRVGHHVVAEEWLRRTVAARFPMADPLPSRPELDILVGNASPDLSWDGHQYSRTATTSKSLLHTSTVYAPMAGGFPAYDAVDQRLRASLDASSAVVIAVPPSRLAATPTVLADRYRTTTVNLTAELLREMRAIAADAGIDWQFLLQVDAMDPVSPDRTRLSRLVATALDRVWSTVTESPDALLLTDIAPLARYGQLTRLAELVSLATPRPAARWVLVPRNVSDHAPTLEGQPVPLGADGWTDLPAEMLTPAAAG